MGKWRLEDVTDEDVKRETREEVKKDLIDKFNQIHYGPNREKLENDLLPSISDDNLRRELEQEIDHPFPCFITFEGKGKEQNLSSVLRRYPDSKYGLEEWEPNTHPV